MRTTILAFVLAAATSGSMAARQPARETPSQVASVDERAPVEVPPPSDRAMAYYRSGNLWWIADIALSIAVLVALLATGFSARLRDLATRVGRKWFFALVLYYVLFTLINYVVDLPRAYFEDFVREHAYGLSNQTLGKWARDMLTSLALNCIIGSLVIWVPYLLLRKSPRRWWFYTGLALIPFIVAGNLVAPIWIAPLFNKFEPMQDKVLEAQILAMADRAGIEGSRVFEVNKSVDTKTLNAYVAGLFNTKRIVLWDTILKRMTPTELLFVMGHEMGHYVLGHVWSGLLVAIVLLMASLYTAYRTAGSVLARWGGQFGFTSLADIASLPLLLLLVSIFSLVVTPLQLAFTRHQEHEADRFGLEMTETNHSAGTAFVKLQEDALANPRPGLMFKLWRESHPPLGERIDFTNEYHPWRDGGPLAYGDRFKR
jgi:Zn-dependent protease with chaperone function